MSFKRVLNKHPNNPVISPKMMHKPVIYTFNPGAVKHNGEYIVMFDAANLTCKYSFWIARSKDGVNFTIDPDPINMPPPCEDHYEDCVYDPRITWFEEDKCYYIVFASEWQGTGVRHGMMKTTDFVNYERLPAASSVGNRNGVLFPEKINGLYCRLERPMGNPHLDPAYMWVSYSPDLIYWGRSKPIMKNRGGGWWDAQKIGGGAVPVKTDKGWLEVYHGVMKTCNGFVYYLGVVMLDLEDPSKVVARGEDMILWPEHDYEMLGRVDNVVFTANMIVEPDETVKIYYGAADTNVGLATGKLSDLIDACYTKNKLRLQVDHLRNNYL